jgi:hypothetical protein
MRSSSALPRGTKGRGEGRGAGRGKPTTGLRARQPEQHRGLGDHTRALLRNNVTPRRVPLITRVQRYSKQLPRRAAPRRAGLSRAEDARREIYLHLMKRPVSFARFLPR